MGNLTLRGMAYGTASGLEKAERHPPWTSTWKFHNVEEVDLPYTTLAVEP